MENKFNALPAEGGAKPAQISRRIYETAPLDRLLAGAVLAWCFLAVDAVLYSPSLGLGLTAAVFAWYALLLLAMRQKLFQTRESRVLLAANLLLGASFALGSNPYFHLWNFLALLALIPIHALSLSAAARLPWQRPMMLWERLCLLFSGLFCHLWAVFSALAPEKDEKKGESHTMAVVLGCFAALGLVSFLLPILTSADALFAHAAQGLVRLFQVFLVQGLWELFLAVLLTPFLFGLLYSLRDPKPQEKPLPEGVPAADGVLFAIILAALDGLYLLFLAVQSAGLFGGPEYLAQRGVSYAEWARSGFFQMVGVTALNLTAVLAAAVFSRREGGAFRAVRILAGILAGESLVLLASAAWRMTLYVGAYGLSFKRFMTYWGMAMMALLLLLALGKALRPERSFCRAAFPLVLAGWLAVNCVPVDYLTARNQVDRYLHHQSPSISVHYLLYSLSYDTLSQLERLDGSLRLSDLEADWWGRDETLSQLLLQRRERAQYACANWRSWSLSACLAAIRD